MGANCLTFKAADRTVRSKNSETPDVSETVGISIMYRESDRSSVAGDLSRNDGGRDGPPKTTAARFEGEPDATPSQPLKPAVRTESDRSPSTKLRSRAPSAPAAARNEL